MNNSLFLSQTTDQILYASTKHNTHDDFWLIPCDASFFCFACAIENLEDPKLLIIRKKRIASHFLTAIIQNKNIWKVLSNNHEVVLHVIGLLVQMLAVINDDEFCKLLSECCLVFVRKSNPDYANNIVSNLLVSKSMLSDNGSHCEHLIGLFCQIIELFPTVIYVLFNEQALHVKSIIKFAISYKQDSIWHLISLILKHSTEDQLKELPQTLVKDLLITLIDCMNNLNSVVLVECVRFLSESKYLSISLKTHECSKYTSARQSVIEAIKKMLLSPDDNIQINAIQCLTSVCRYDTNSSIRNIMLEKGLTEFLLELLSSTKQQVVSETLCALQQLIEVEKFSTMGHLLYCFAPVVSAIKRLEDHPLHEIFYNGVMLFHSMLNKITSSELLSITENQISDVFDLFKISLMKSNENIRFLAVSCFQLYMFKSEAFSLLAFEQSFKLIEIIFLFIETDFLILHVSKSHIQFACNAYKIVMLLARKLQVKVQSLVNNSKDASFVDLIFFYVDKNCIPEAISKFLPSKSFDFESIFYEMLLVVLELDLQKGEELARKLAQAAFLRNVHEFKVVSRKSSKQLDIIAAKLLFYLCLSVEKDSLENELKENLFKCFVTFDIAFSDWKFLLNKHSSNSFRKDLEFVTNARISILALLTYSHAAGQCFTSILVLHPYLQGLASSKSLLDTLPTLGKRFLIYLWCQVNELSFPTNQHFAQAQKNMMELCLISINVTNIFFTCLPLLIWSLKLDVDAVKQKITRIYLQKISDKVETVDSLLLQVQHANQQTKFVDVLLNVLSDCKDLSIIEHSLFLFFELSKCLKEDELSKLKCSIRMILLINENSLAYYNISVIFKCLNFVEANDMSCSVSEENLKLFCRSLKYASDNLTPRLQLQVLNFISIVLTKASEFFDSRVIFLLLKNISVLEEFESNVFTKFDLLCISKSSALAEEVNAVSILILSKLIDSVEKLAASPKPLRVLKCVFIEGLMCHQLIIIQASLLNFWREFFKTNCRSKLVQLITKCNSDLVNTTITPQDLHFVCIGLQNFVYHQNLIVRELAIDCIEQLQIKFSEKSLFFRSPWSGIILTVVLEKILKPNEASMVCLLTLFVKEKQFNQQIIEAVVELSKDINNHELSFINEVLHLIEIVCPRINNISILCDIRRKLKEVDKSRFKTPNNHKKIEFQVFRGVVLSRAQDYDIMSRFQKTFLTLEKTISLIEGELSTESDEA